MLPVLLTAVFMGPFDFFVVNVAAPSLQSDLNAGSSQLELVVGGYAFAYASGLITGGRLGDVLSYRRMFVLGMGAFTAASALCGLAQTPGQLIAFRFLQGLTAAVMVPQVLALITAVFPAGERPRAVAWYSTVISVAAACGQAAGGLLLEADVLGLGWRSIFLINVPLGLVALPLAARLLPDLRTGSAARFDVLGALGLATALGLVLAPLVLGQDRGWPAWTFVLLALSPLTLAAVIRYERRVRARGGHPVLDLGLLGERRFAAGLAVNFLIMSLVSGLMLGLTLYLQGGRHASPLEAGLVFVPTGLAVALAPAPARRLAARHGHRVLVWGTLAAAAGLVLNLVAVTAFRPSLPVLTLCLSLFGIANGVVFSSMVTAVLARVRPDQAGAASGLVTTAQQFAMAASVALLGTVFFAVLGSDDGVSGHARAFGAVLLSCLAMALAAAALSRLLAPEPAAAPDERVSRASPTGR